MHISIVTIIRINLVFLIYNTNTILVSLLYFSCLFSNIGLAVLALFYYMHHKQRLLKYLINKTYYYFECYTIFVILTLNPDNMTQKVLIEYLLIT